VYIVTEYEYALRPSELATAFVARRTQMNAMNRGYLGRACVAVAAIVLCANVYGYQSNEPNTARGAAPQSGAAAAGRQMLKGYRRPEWTNAPLVGPLEPSVVLILAISLPVRDRAALDAMAHDVSDPKSPNYRQFLTPAQTVQRFSPTARDYAALKAYAQKQGFKVVRTYNNRYLLDVTGTVGVIQRAFHVTMNNYRRPDGTTFFAPDREPSLDLDLPILYIAGLEDFVLPQHLGAPTQFAGSGPLGSLVSQDFRNLYAANTTLTGKGQTVGLLEFAAPNDTDIHGNGTSGSGYAGWTSPPAGLTWPPFSMWPPGTQQSSLTGLSQTQLLPIIEAELDIEMAMAMAPGLDQTVVYVVTQQPASNLVQQLANAALIDSGLNAMVSPPSGYPLSLQLSASVSWVADAATQQILASMTMQGQSFFLASGDTGSYGASSSGCTTSPFLGTSAGLFWESDLALDFATFVGGTLWAAAPYGEISWNSSTSWANSPAGWASGGGIIAGVAIPVYQNQLVPGIAANGNGASTTSRNLPDVAAAAANVFSYVAGEADFESGTSAATPLWAGFTALVNQQRQQLNPGIGGMGFLNPTLYAIARSPQQYNADFHDVTVGNNASGACSGFNATTGYDLVTGLGSPTGQLLNDLGSGISLTVTPSIVSPTSPVAQLAWWSINGANCTASTTCTNISSGKGCLSSTTQWNGPESPSGQMTVNPVQAPVALRGTGYTYTFTCTNPHNVSTQATAHVTVRPLCEVNGAPCFE
jgi:subtilase family serine protease